MLKNSVLFCLLLLMPFIYIHAQNEDVIRCATNEYLEMMDHEFPDYQAQRHVIEAEVQQWIADNIENFDKERNIITIPVVFHIIYFQDHPAFNLPDSRVHEQLDVLNKDFRRQNSDATQTPSVFQAVAADCQIEFCLAQRTPTGQYSNGIVRVQTTVSQFSIGNAMKYTSQGGSNAWDRNKYLNIWVCNLGGGILGFATPPGSAAATDGVVIHYRNFGVTGSSAPYNEGRTATHEVGHWLNLQHIWGDDAPGACTGTDYCNDTPNQADPYYGCPSHPQTSCGSQDMFMNYMDYVDDGCMNTFTNNQKMRMWATLNGARASIKTSDGCVPGQGMSADFTETINFFSAYPNPSSGELHLNLHANNEVADVVVSVYNSYGQLSYSETINVNATYLETRLDLSHLAKGLYILNVKSEKFSQHKTISLIR